MATSEQFRPDHCEEEQVDALQQVMCELDSVEQRMQPSSKYPINLEELRGGSNTVFKVSATSLAGQVVEGVFKPGSGEKELWDSPRSNHELYKRERAAYLVNVFLGQNLIPETVIATIYGEEGSLQRFIEGAVGFRNYTGLMAWGEQTCTMALFDYLLWNKDRQLAHILIDPEENFSLIDNGLSFDYRGERLISSNLEYFTVGQLFPESLALGIAQLTSNSSMNEALNSALASLLPSVVLDAFHERLGFLNRMSINRERISRRVINRMEYYP